MDKDKSKDFREVIQNGFKIDLSYNYSHHDKLMKWITLICPSKKSRCDIIKSTNRDLLHGREGHNVMRCSETD